MLLYIKLDWCPSLSHFGSGLQVQGLVRDASNVEAIACIAADHFYSDQPELALRYYRRLLQVGWVHV